MARLKEKQKTTVKFPVAASTWLTGKRLYILIIFAFSFALYFNTLFNDYNLDDELVTRNHKITSLGWDALKFNFDAFNSVELQDSGIAQRLKFFLPLVFRVPYYQDNAGFKYEYRPVVFASFALEHALFAQKNITGGAAPETDSATTSHFINNLLYGLLCVLLFTVLCRLFSGYNIIFPFLITLLFTAYPMHTEDVASIKNRDELLALIFGLLSLRFSLAYILKNNTGSLVLVFFCFIAGILSKPTTITFALLIPLCIVMFTPGSFSKLMLISAVLIIPSVFYSRLYSLLQQFNLGVALFLAVTALYIIKNRQSFTQKLKAFSKDFFSWFQYQGHNPALQTVAITYTDLKKPMPVLLFILGALVPSAISVSGISMQDPWLACLPFTILCIVYIFANNELKLAFITPLSLVTLFALVKFAHHSGFIETGLIVFLASQIFSGVKAFRIAGIANYIIYGLASVVFLHSLHFLVIVIFAGLVNRKLLIVTLLMLAASAILLIKKTWGFFNGNHELLSMNIFSPALYVFLFLLWKGNWKQAVNAASATLAVLLIVCFTWVHPEGNRNTLLTAKGIYHTINGIKAADATPVQSVRPLNFPEYPISNKAPFSIKLGTAMEVLAKYMRMVLIPYPMSYYYGYSVISPQRISDFIPLLSVLFHLLLLATAIYFFRKMPVLSFSILFYLISIAVFSTLMTAVPGMVADRFLLIPSIGYCVFCVYVCSLLFKQDFETRQLSFASLKPGVKVLLGVVLVLYSGLTFSRNAQWKDQVTLFRHDITVVENSAQAQNLLGVHLLLSSNHETDPGIQKQLREEAVPHFKKALEIYPGFLNASYDLGRTLESLQLPDQAFEQYQVTVKIDTTFVAPYFNMATIMHNKGNYEAAVPLYQKFLTKYPKQLEAYTNLSFAYFQLHDFDKSIATNRRAIIATGEPFYPIVNIAKTYTVMGQKDSALFYFEQAHAIQPNDGGVNLNISRLKGQAQ